MLSAVSAYHIFYEQHKLWQNTKWLGVPMWKLPFDAFVIQDIIFEIKPDFIIETGTGNGGASLFYASICEMLDHGRVITMDIQDKRNFGMEAVKQNIQNRINFLNGSSVNKIVVDQIFKICKGKRNIVLLDSWHTGEHVLRELQLYSPLVPIDSYIIVEDTHMNGHPVPWNWGPGPFEAVQEFMKNNDEFEIDYSRDVYMMTFNPSGYLRRVK